VKTLHEADYAVVGTGAGGATAARTLARAGHSVALIEEGPDRRGTPGEATTRDTMLGRFRDFAAQFASGASRIPILQAKMVGGSTAINSAIFWQLPEYVHADWSKADAALGRALPYAEIGDVTAEIERDLSVRAVERRVLGRNNELLEKGAAALGLKGNVIRRAESGCEGSARCLHGCPNKRRQGMDVSYVPDAIANGAALLTGTKALRVRLEGGRASGVETSRGFVRASRGVVLSAGALHTPWLLWRSGLRRAIGERFTAHPGFAVAGVFPHKVELDRGATQGYEVTELRAQGMKLEGLGVPVPILASRLPGAGATYRKYSDRLDHIASWACLVRPEKHGRLAFPRLGGIKPSLTMGAGDYARVLTAMKYMVRLFFAAGATEVLPGLFGLPESLTSVDQIERVSAIRPTDVSMLATHLFGGAVLGSDPATSVVDPSTFTVHGVAGLHVADASLIPTTLGVNPQGTIMALSRIAADRIANASRVRAAA